MDKITGINHAAKILHDRSTENTSKAQKKSTSTSGSKNSNKTRQPDRQKLPLKELEQLIKSKVSSMDSNDKNFIESANNIIVEQLLTWEFGEEIADDPEFITLKRKISTAIKNNVPLNDDFDKLINSMLNK